MNRPSPILAKGILAMLRISNRDIAREYGCTEQYVGRVLNGHQPPSERFRRYLSARLNRTEAELFATANLVEAVAS